MKNPKYPTKFSGNSSLEYSSAVQSMRNLGSLTCYEECRRAFATAVASLAREEFSARFGNLTESSRPCIQRLLGKSCAFNRQKMCECSPPGDDHGTLWLKDGKPFAYVSQPYSIGGDTLKEIYEFAKENRLRVTLRSDWAFYFPSSALIVIYTKDDA